MKKFSVFFLACAVACANDPPPGEVGTEQIPVTLATPVSARVAIHVSDTVAPSAACWSHRSWKWWHMSRGLEEVFRSDGTPYVVIRDAQIAAGELMDGASPRYPIVFSLANECTSDQVLTNVTNYVSAGGWLYVGSSSFTKTETGVRRSTNPLYAAMGISGGAWRLQDHVRRVEISPLVDHMDTIPEYRFRPLTYDINQFGVDQPYHGSNWAWSVEPAASSPATTLLARSYHGRPLVFGPQADDPPSRPTGAFFEAVELNSLELSYPTWFGDVDGDSTDDLISRDPTSGTLLLGLSTGQVFRNFAGAGATIPQTSEIRVGDADGDGLDDVVYRSAGTVQVCRSTGASFLTCAGWGTWAHAMFTLADVDGNGRADVVGRAADGTIRVALSTGSTFAEQGTSWASGVPAEVFFGRLDGNTQADLVTRSGTTLHCALSNGAGFGALQPCGALLSPSDTITLGDVSGDGLADIVTYRDQSDVRVGLRNASTAAFDALREWDHTPPEYAAEGAWDTLLTRGAGNALVWAFTSAGLADVNGDGRLDQMIRGPSGFHYLGALLSAGGRSSTAVEIVLAEKNYGSGRFIFDGVMQPSIGYGTYAAGPSEYKVIRRAVDGAFHARGLPVVRLSPWPYPYRSAFVYRHDHPLNTLLSQLELEFLVRGEYFIYPDSAEPDPNNPAKFLEGTDYPAGAPQALDFGSVIGVHALGHQPLDFLSESAASTLMNNSLNRIQTDTGVRPSNFVAPGFYAVRMSSMRALLANNIVTGGEQSAGPFPHFALNLDANEPHGASDGYLLHEPGRVLLQVPCGGVSEGTFPTWFASTDVTYEVGGIINNYDHAGALAGDSAWDNNFARNDATNLASAYLSYVLHPERSVWRTTSRELREHWLERERRSMAVTTLSGESSFEIRVQRSTPAPRRLPGNYTDASHALRIELDERLALLAADALEVTLEGRRSENFVLDDRVLIVKVGDADRAVIRFGSDPLADTSGTQTVTIELDAMIAANRIVVSGTTGCTNTPNSTGIRMTCTAAIGERVRIERADPADAAITFADDKNSCGPSFGTREVCERMLEDSWIVAVKGKTTTQFPASPRSFSTTKTMSSDARVLPGDFNGDGKSDVLVIDGAEARVGLSNGTSYEGWGLWYAPPTHVVAQLRQTGAARTFTGDFDGDKRTDFMFYHPPGTTWVGLSRVNAAGQPFFDFSPGNWYHNPDPTLVAALSQNGSARTFIADFDGDGRSDFMFIYSGTAWVGLSTGTAFAWRPWYTNSEQAQNLAANGAAKTFIADFNGDGRSDFGFAFGSAIYVELSNGASRFVFQDGGAWQIRPGYDYSSGSVFPGDFDGNGLADLGVYYGGVIFMLRSTGTDFLAPEWWAVPETQHAALLAPGSGARLAVSDYTGDGRSDLLAALGGNWWIWASDGTRFAQRYGFITERPVQWWGTTTMWTDLNLSSIRTGTGDFDGDGRADFLLATDRNFTVLDSGAP